MKTCNDRGAIPWRVRSPVIWVAMKTKRVQQWLIEQVRSPVIWVAMKTMKMHGRSAIWVRSPVIWVAMKTVRRAPSRGPPVVTRDLGGYENKLRPITRSGAVTRDLGGYEKISNSMSSDRGAVTRDLGGYDN